jgi:addiction module RelB/DinJ family antitoxin
MYTTITVKTNKQLRDDVKKTANELGIPMTTAVNALLSQFVRDKEIVLSLNMPNAVTKRAIREARVGKNIETFKSFGDWKKTMRSS